MITIPGSIPIRIHPIFWVFTILLSALNGSDSPFKFASWMIVIFASVLIHEFGHALTAVAFGQRARIDLTGFGGLTQRRGPAISSWKDFMIVLNGPLAGVLLCCICYFLLTRPVTYSPNVHYLLQLFFAANIFWTGVNLIPVQPLDGGHLLRISLEGMFGINGIKAALFISLILAIAAAVVFFAFNYMLGGILFMMLTYENYKMWKSSLSLSSADQNIDLQHLLKQAQADYQQHHAQEALQKLEHVRTNAPGGVLEVAAAVLEADILHQEGNIEKAYSILSPLKSKLSPTGLRQLQDLAYKTKHWNEAIDAGTKAYQAEASYEAALLNAMSQAQMHNVGAAVGWIKCAVREGAPHIESVLTLPDFDPIRLDPAFKSFATNISG